MSTPPSVNLDEEAESLDSEISAIRAELRTLQHRRRVLASSLLSSRPLQRLAKSQSPSQTSTTTTTKSWTDLSPLLHSSSLHSNLNHHRIAFSTTAFPFTDPSPTAEAKNLLGLRIDICARDGTYTKPYYILLRKVRRDTADGKGKGKVKGEQQRLLYVHRHTIPAVVDVSALERVYLPRLTGATTGKNTAQNGDGGEIEQDVDEEEEEAQLKPWKRKVLNGSRKQDLKAFVREVRRQLVVWHLRCDAVRYLRERLGVVRRGEQGAGGLGYGDEEDGVWERDVLVEGNQETRIARNELGIVSLGATALEAVYVRVEWEDGRVGRFKISNAGLVERAVVMGDSGRDKLMEGVMTGGRVETLLDRLMNSRKYASEPKHPAASPSEVASRTVSEV
ncbi:uncharacterized protein BO97DRAFT_368845 [Aspergillus homomorphus CBS 101889]|uniref:Cenp-O kinetochore centromere component n=1 Tax=Aspergillus homomorphus (strain CBS 101889) TaxID=1450537 RepID=A0A395I0Y1_ASPHC|nr:hypothetical protein BO97DRAFT_368845 [Aspergillus homomorphus CBS 101889]RAL12194.1 hypothetical protein BO97DRAFT_368845 [Aspergillus homomorphus CBS 101889]